MEKAKLLKNIILIIIASALFVFLSLICVHFYQKFGVNPEAWVAHIQGFGIYSFLVLLLFQLLQVFIAIIPGEVIEIAAGMLFDPILAAAVCYFGVFLASALIFFLMRKAGKRYSKLFISEEKLQSFRFINTKEKLKRTAFLLFLIPGTPKDLLIYFFAVTPIKFSDFIVITMIARFPSVVSSIIGGSYIGDREYIKAVIVFAVTALISLIGLLIYNKLKIHLEKRRLNKK